MIVVGLTGGIGSGKTTVAKFFEELGIPVYIADNAAKELSDKDPEVRKQITQLFGKKAYLGEVLNRKYISSVVFNDKEKLEALNAIVHPAVRRHFEHWKQAQNAPYVIYEAAILFEKGGHETCDYTLLVIADKEEKIKRLLQRDQATEAEIEARMANQWSDENKIPLADFVVENHVLSETFKKVQKIHRILLKAA